MPSDSELERRADLLINDHWQLIDRLVAIRKERGLTVEEVACRAGSDPKTITEQIEWNVVSPTLSLIRRYAMAVGATTHTIITKENDA